VLLAAMAACGCQAWDVFFRRQPYDVSSWNAFSTSETRIAEIIRDEVDRPHKNTDVYVPDTLLGTPTETLVLGHKMMAESFEPGQNLPLPYKGHDALVFLGSQQPEVPDLIRRYYPRTSIEAFGPPRPDGSTGTPTVLWIARISAEDIESLRGWTVEYATPSGPTVARAASSDFDWSAAPRPRGLVNVRGVLRVLQGGTYELALSGGTPAIVLIAGEPIFERAGRVSVTLAAGKYPVRLSARLNDSSTRTTLSWVGPDNPRGGPITIDHLWRPIVDSGGLLARYFSGTECQGEPAWQQVDPVVRFYFHTLRLPRPFSVCWSGSLFAPEDGEYRLGTVSVDSSSVRVDGLPLMENLVVNSYADAPITLQRGWHRIDVTFHNLEANGAQIYLYWTRPGSAMELVPAWAMLPPGPKKTFRSLRDPPPEGHRP
jgi:hypothetical protein